MVEWVEWVVHDVENSKQNDFDISVAEEWSMKGGLHARRISATMPRQSISVHS
jgi:hypothetical protein